MFPKTDKVALFKKFIKLLQPYVLYYNRKRIQYVIALSVQKRTYSIFYVFQREQTCVA